jgi:hypothetical protein
LAERIRILAEAMNAPGIPEKIKRLRELTASPDEDIKSNASAAIKQLEGMAPRKSP